MPPIADDNAYDEDEQEQLRRRLKAALAVTGLTVPQLAKRLPGRGYGAKTLYNMQSLASDREITPRDCKIIAEALGLDPAFFTIDFANIGGTELVQLQRDVDELKREVRVLNDRLLGLAERGESPRRPGQAPGDRETGQEPHAGENG